MNYAKKTLFVLFLFLGFSIFPYGNLQAQTQEQAAEMVFAVLQNNLKKVEQLIASGVPAGVTPRGGMSALQIAVQNNRLEIAKLLIKNGANVNSKDAYGSPMLHFAFKEPMIRLLLDNGAKINAEYMGYTAYENYAAVRHFASEAYRNKTTAEIRKQKLSPQMQKQALSASQDLWLTKQDIYDVVKLYDEKGYNPLLIRKKKSDARNALFEAAKESNYEVIQGILDLNKYTINGILNKDIPMTVLSLITDNPQRTDTEYDAIVTSMIKHGTDVNEMAGGSSASTSASTSPLMIAACNDNVNRCKTLIKLGAKISKTNEKKHHALFFAKSVPMAQYLVSCGADPLSRDKFNQTLLFGNGNNNAALLRYYVSKGVKVDDVDFDGFTALFYSFDSEAVKYLIASGADVNHRNNAGESIIEYIAQNLLEYMKKGSDGQDKLLPKIKILLANRIDKESVRKAYSLLKDSNLGFSKTLTVLENYLRR